MFEIVTRDKIWIVLVLRLALNSVDALENPCRLTAGNGAAQWMNEDGSLRFPAYFEGGFHILLAVFMVTQNNTVILKTYVV